MEKVSCGISPDNEIINVPELYGSMVFNDAAMKARLPQDVYQKLKETIDQGSQLDAGIANIVAGAMMDWALEKGATHFSHWFLPMTGITAEKHDSFITPGVPLHSDKVLMKFSGKELIKGEPDASSFPSGGLRSTFEARGYTAWDPTSYAFIKEGVLVIPSIFCSYSGEVLDKKTPLLRSIALLDKSATKLLHTIGMDDVKRVIATVGPEQEYFLVDRKFSYQRKDILFAGRTLFGAKPPKSQELDDHYFGALKIRISAFMRDLNLELWKLGILAKTQHNEAAPAQYELAPIFCTTNTSTDHNQLTMEIMKKVARRHGFSCLLHEKPFAGINGSGKHNNWSMSTDTGINLLDPGDHPENNLIFMLCLAAVTKAVDDYQDLLRMSVANAGNDHRLGAAEAPPAIISIFLGDYLNDIINSFIKGTKYEAEEAETMQIGVDTVPEFFKDTTDRNRTSPFAFTGNKFEFRMLGSSSSIADSNIVLNTIIADALDEFADELASAEDMDAAIKELIAKTFKEHKRILFDGNNYSEEWVTEAEKRGLLNLKSAPEAIPYLIAPKNIELFTRHGIYSKEELTARCEILFDNYCKVLNIEALTMLDMSRKEIIPAVNNYIKAISDTAVAAKAALPGVNCEMQTNILNRVCPLAAELYNRTEVLDKAVADTKLHRSIGSIRL